MVLLSVGQNARPGQLYLIGSFWRCMCVDCVYKQFCTAFIVRSLQLFGSEQDQHRGLLIPM